MPGMFGKREPLPELPTAPDSPETLFLPALPPGEDPGTTHLTRELLDWAIAALTTVLSTSEVRALQAHRGSVGHALKQLDLLWPHVLRREAHVEARASLTSEIANPSPRVRDGRRQEG